MARSRDLIRNDPDLLPHMQATATSGARRFAWILMFVLALFFLCFFGWSSMATMDDITRGDGKIIPTSQTQVIQNLDGGILREILVRDGDTVQAGQVLLRIDNVAAQSDLLAKQQKFLTLQAMAARLDAEANNRSSIAFPETVLREAPQVAQRERDFFQSRRNKLSTELDVLTRQLEQRESQLRELNSSIGKLDVRARSLNEELADARRQVREGALSRVELLRTEREYNETVGELRTTRLSVPRAESAVRESKQKLEEHRATFNAEVRKDLNEVNSQMNALRESMTGDTARVRRTEVKSPVRGIVKQVKINTIGGTIRGGENLIEITPLDDILLVEAKIKPADVAFLKPDQPAVVKITAYDYSIYGGLDGKVVDISADTIKEVQPASGREETYYRVRIRTAKNSLDRGGVQYPIIPGMTVSVDITTGQKTVLDYMVRPLLAARDNALRER